MNGKTWAAFFTLSAIWGASFLAIKLVLRDLSPFTLVAVRLALGSIGLWIIMVMTKTQLPKDRSTLLLLALLGITNVTLPYLLIANGQQTIDSGVASILNSTTPLHALILAHFFLSDERITWNRLLGLMIGFGGVALIFSDGQRYGFGALDWPVLRGQLLVLGGPLCYAASGVFVRRRLREVEPVVVGTISITTAFVASTLLALLVDGGISIQMQATSWLALLWLSVLGVSVAQVLYFFVMSQWGATRTTMVTYVIPLVSVILGAIVLSEAVTVSRVGGFALIAAGIALVNRKVNQPAPARLAETGAD
ncbi:MAG: DMT family transporter [Chloroflexi bacterium]|nr:DMT family transporter [Chloroflexota bacterium]